MPVLITRARVILAHLKPITLSTGFALSLPLRALPFSTSQTRGNGDASVTRYMVRQAQASAPRESPFPVVFLRAKGLELEEEDEWKDWSAMFAERGYTAVEIDITAPSSASLSLSASPDANPEPSTDAGASPLKPMTSLLASQIRLLAIPFPPIVVAQRGSCLLAQAYIEDHPASGLVLIHPPPDEDPRSSPSSSPSTAPAAWTWPKFTYEPHFPLLIMSTHVGLQELSVNHRIVREGDAGKGLSRRRGKGLDLEVLEKEELDERGRLGVERWMDRCGF